MATTKRATTAKKATKKTTKKASTAAKKTTRKAATRTRKATSTAEKATTELIDDAASQANSFTDQAAEAVESANERIDEMLMDAVKFGRKASYVSVGAPFAIRARVEDNTLFDVASYDKFVAEAQGHGVYRIGQIEEMVEPYVKQFQDAVDPIVDRVESVLPEQAQKVLADSRERLNKLINA